MPISVLLALCLLGCFGLGLLLTVLGLVGSPARDA